MTSVRARTDERGIVWLTLARPERKNAFDAATIAELTHAARAMDANARAVVLAGEGDSFCAGADLNWMKHLPYGEGTLRIEPLGLALREFDRPATVITESPDEASNQAIREELYAAVGTRSAKRASSARASASRSSARRNSA